MQTHPIREEQVLAYAANELTGAEHQRIAAHVTHCDVCAEIVQDVRAVRAVLQADDSREPPPYLIEQVCNLFALSKPATPPGKRSYRTHAAEEWERVVQVHFAADGQITLQRRQRGNVPEWAEH